MAYDPNLWVPIGIAANPDLPEIPEGLPPELKEYVTRLHQMMRRQQTAVSRLFSILNRFRVIVDADKPTATGSKLLWVDTATDTLYYDKPGAPAAWTAL